MIIEGIMIEDVKKQVKDLLTTFKGHSFDHVERVYKTAIQIANKEGADEQIVALAALLHDTDDYKFVGIEDAKKLLNAKSIMQKMNLDFKTQSKVCEIILSLGYSNRLKGIYPTSLEGQIVSDADMLDAMGAMAIVRTLEYGLSKKAPIFQKDIFPKSDITPDEYQQKAEKEDIIIHHFFDKLLKLKYLLFTKTAQQLGEDKHQFMIDFLILFFKENNQEKWITYLEDYLKTLSIKYNQQEIKSNN